MAMPKFSSPRTCFLASAVLFGCVGVLLLATGNISLGITCGLWSGVFASIGFLA